MKKIYLLKILCLTLILAFASSCGSSKSAQSSGFSFDDEIKQRLSEFNSAGWQIHGTARTLKGKLYEHFEKMNSNPNLKEVIGVVTNVRSVNTARLAAINSASIQYASVASNYVKGRMISDARLNQSEPDEADMFYAAYSNRIETSIAGLLVESFSVIQRSENGVNNYETFFLLDEEAARKLRKTAIKEALEKSKLSIEQAKKVSDFAEDKPE